MAMPTTLATLKAFAFDNGLDLRAYSGRGMMGKYCAGISFDQYTFPSSFDLPNGWRMDSLGMGQIVYWPSVKWPDGEEG